MRPRVLQCASGTGREEALHPAFVVPVDWAGFREDVIALLKSVGDSYYIKKGLLEA